MLIVRIAVTVLAFLFLYGCDNEQVYAPVTDASVIEHIPQTGAYTVVAGDTLYSIAWKYGLDYRYVAKRNGVATSYHIVPGQKIYLTGHTNAIVRMKKAPATAVTVTSEKTVTEPQEREPSAKVSQWHWPAKGPIIGAFSDSNKGINIGGQEGDPILATAAGKVVYCGSGLRGYGNLIIIKHNSLYLTAYAHNSLVLVKEGQLVKSGQKIAEMGHTGSRRVMLHFEIRRGGQPVNPASYLS